MWGELSTILKKLSTVVNRVEVGQSMYSNTQNFSLKSFLKEKYVLKYEYAKASVPTEEEKAHASPWIFTPNENKRWAKSDKKTNCQRKSAHQYLIPHASKYLPYQSEWILPEKRAV